MSCHFSIWITCICGKVFCEYCCPRGCPECGTPAIVSVADGLKRAREKCEELGILK